MTSEALNAIVWLEPWSALDTVAADSLTTQLQRELSPGHVLHGRTARALGKGEDDHVLFEVEGPQQWAVVALTGKRHSSSERPHVMLFESIAEFVEGCMEPDHAEFSDDED